MRPTLLKIDLTALVKNFQAFKSHVGKTKIMGVVKANAYGHGLVECARVLETAGSDYLGVAFVEEGIELRRAGISLPVLVLGGILGSQIEDYVRHDLDLTASSISKLEAIDEVARISGKRARVHLKIDTGMERIGVHHYSSQSFFEAALKSRACEIVGIYSHFASVPASNLSLAKLQLERFLEATSYLEKRSVPMPVRHIANTAAVLNFPESFLDLVRPGIGLYGVWPGEDCNRRLPLVPVMSLVSKVVYFKVVKAGAGVSYGHLWKSEEDTRMVTIPIGYGDGYPRGLSNKGQVLIRGNLYPIRGAVCMDQLMVDIGWKEAYNGDEVVLIGKQGENELTFGELATQANLIPYEMMVSLNLRIPRIYRRTVEGPFEPGTEE